MKPAHEVNKPLWLSGLACDMHECIFAMHGHIAHCSSLQGRGPQLQACHPPPPFPRPQYRSLPIATSGSLHLQASSPTHRRLHK